MRTAPLLLALAVGCAGPSSPDAGHDAGADAAAALDGAPPADGALPDAGGSDAGLPDAATADAGTDASAPSDAGPSCLDAHAAGERYSAGDGCNFCVCGADGAATCTARTCPPVIGECMDAAGGSHPAGARFLATDGCNECVCAYSGLACTRRASCPALDEGAIWLESPDASCGDFPAFTARSVIDGIPFTSFELPFLYDRARPSFPETSPDSTVRFRFDAQDGIAVCLGMPTHPIIDVEATAEWVTEDGAFDEGFRTVVRRYGNTTFVDAWHVNATAPRDGLNGTYTYSCLDRGDYGFTTSIHADGSVMGMITKTCESDISVAVGTFERAAGP